MGISNPIFQVGEKVNWILDDNHLAFRIVANSQQPLKNTKGLTQFPQADKDYIICPIQWRSNGISSYVHVLESQLFPFSVID